VSQQQNKDGKLKVVAVVPCYNESLFIRCVLMSIHYYVDEVIVADDGSEDNTVEEASSAGASICLSGRNGHRGAGDATWRGIKQALENGADIVVTLDGDGQHKPSEVPTLVKPIRDGIADLCVGVRMGDGMPGYRRFGNRVITCAYNMLSSRKIVDSQCCLRAFSRAFLENIEVVETGFGFSTEMLIKARSWNYRIKEIPVSTIYHKDTYNNSTLHAIPHGLGVLLSTIKWRVKVELSSLIHDWVFKAFKMVVNPFIGSGLGRVWPIGAIYRNTARALVTDTVKRVQLNGFKMDVRLRKGRDIDGIGQQLIFSHTYEPVSTRLFTRVVGKGMVVADVGANIGYYTLLAASRVGEGGVVCAFEPEPKNFAELCHNINLNKFENIRLFQKAVSGANGVAPLYISEHESGEHSLVKCRRYRLHPLMVETVSLDSVLDKVDILKVDTEGNEFEVIEGAKRLSGNGVEAILLEIWQHGLETSGHSLVQFWELMMRYHFKHTLMADEFSKQVIEAHLADVARYIDAHHGFSVNVLFTNKEVR